MAARDSIDNINTVDNTGIVRQLLTRLNELSSAMIPQDNNNVESEVRRVFRPNNATSSQTTETSHSSINSGASVTGGEGIQQNSQRRAPYFMPRRNFSGQRPSNSTRSRKQKKPSAIDNRQFMRDLILLGGPDTVRVPRQGTRLALMESGHMISGCKFTKGMTAAQVEIAIVEALDGKIPPGVDIEILMSMHTSLVALSLAPGQQGIDGAIVQRLFQTKPIYVRPSRQILMSSKEMVQQV